jgi:hypothetical protein
LQNTTATTDVAGAPLGFGDVLFSQKDEASVFFPLVEAAPQVEAFLA